MAPHPPLKRSIDMIRYLQVLGLALMAACALSAMVASAASADEFVVTRHPATLTGRHDPGTALDAFSTTAGEVKCEETSYHGTQLNEKATSVTVTAVYAGCTAFGGFAGATVHMNSCDYKFTLDPAPATTGTVHIQCTTPGDSITVTATSFGTNKCTVHVPPQTVHGVTYTNIGAGETEEVTVTINATGANGTITYTHTSGTGFGACTGAGTTVQHDGTFVGHDIVTGEEDPGSGHIGVIVK
jgi:hypothetical protein